MALFDCYQPDQQIIYKIKNVYFRLYNIINYVPALYKINYRHTSRLNLYLRSILKIMNNDKTNLSITKQHHIIYFYMRSI